jgi:predicted kinase
VYIRSKRIKGHTYYYLVKCERQGKKVTQKFIGYLGKAGAREPAFDPAKMALGAMGVAGFTKGQVAPKEHSALTGSKKKYFNVRKNAYKAVRAKLHASLIEDIIKAKPQSVRPTITFITGSPASGKSKFMKEIALKDNPDAIVADADLIKPHLGKDGIYVHDESSDVVQSLYRRALKEKKDVIFVGNIKNTDKYRQMLYIARERGYIVNAAAIEAPSKKEIARRATIRNLDASHPQTVPLQVVMEGLQDYAGGLRLLQDFGKVTFYESQKGIFTRRDISAFGAGSRADPLRARMGDQATRLGEVRPIKRGVPSSG